jgi:hypothetical protein
MAQIDHITGYISNSDKIQQEEYPTLHGMPPLCYRRSRTQLIMTRHNLS